MENYPYYKHGAPWWKVSPLKSDQRASAQAVFNLIFYFPPFFSFSFFSLFFYRNLFLDAEFFFGHHFFFFSLLKTNYLLFFFFVRPHTRE